MTQQTDAPSSIPGSTTPQPRPISPAEAQAYQASQAAQRQSSEAYRAAQSARDSATALKTEVLSLKDQLSQLTTMLTQQGEEARAKEVTRRLAAGEIETPDAVQELVNIGIRRAGVDPATGKLLRQAPEEAPPVAPEPVQQPGGLPLEVRMNVGTSAILAAHGLRGNEPGLVLNTANPRAVLESVLNYQAALRATGPGSAAVPAAPVRDGGQPARLPGQGYVVEDLDKVIASGGSRGMLRPKQAAEQLRKMREAMPDPVGNSFLAE